MSRMAHLQALAHPNRVFASLAQHFQKPPAILIVGEDGTALIAAGHLMACRSRKFDAQGPGHILNYITPTPGLCQTARTTINPNHWRDACGSTQKVHPFGSGKAVGGTPTAVVGTTALPKKSLMIRRITAGRERRLLSAFTNTKIQGPFRLLLKLSAFLTFCFAGKTW
jgi:hypothetical protein